MIKTKEEYVKMLAELAENGKLSKAIYEGKIDGSTIECFDKQMEILEELLDYECFNQTFEDDPGDES